MIGGPPSTLRRKPLALWVHAIFSYAGEGASRHTPASASAKLGKVFPKRRVCAVRFSGSIVLSPLRSVRARWGRTLCLSGH